MIIKSVMVGQQGEKRGGGLRRKEVTSYRPGLVDGRSACGSLSQQASLPTYLPTWPLPRVGVREGGTGGRLVLQHVPETTRHTGHKGRESLSAH